MTPLYLSEGDAPQGQTAGLRLRGSGGQLPSWFSLCSHLTFEAQMNLTFFSAGSEKFY